VIRRVVFRPAAVRDLARLDRVVQARIDAALVRFAATGHGDVKSLKDRPGELRLRVGKWRVFFSLEPPDLIPSSALTTGVKLTDQSPRKVRPKRGASNRLEPLRETSNARPGQTNVGVDGIASKPCKVSTLAIFPLWGRLAACGGLVGRHGAVVRLFIPPLWPKAVAIHKRSP